MRLRVIVAALLALGLVTTACSDDVDSLPAPGSELDTESTTSLPLDEVDEPSARPECEDPSSLAERIRSANGADIDYQGSASPSEMAMTGDGVVLAELDVVDVESGQVVVDLRSVETVVGEPFPERLRAAVWFHVAGGTEIVADSGEIGTVHVLASLWQNGAAAGGFEVDTEGLWLACSRVDVAHPAHFAPTREGWPVQTSLDEIVDLIENPPRLADGPVVRRSGLREVSEMSAPEYSESISATGLLQLTGDCLILSAADGRVALVWPPGTRWLDAASVVLMADDTEVAVGATLEAAGPSVPAFWVRYDVGTEAGDAIDMCSADVSVETVLLVQTAAQRG